MSLKIVPESLNLYCEKPTERLSGQSMADVYVLVAVANTSSDTLVLAVAAATLTLTSISGQLILVETAQQINGKWAHEELEFRGNSEKALKITFLISAEVFGKSSDVDKMNLDIGYDSVSVTKGLLKIAPGVQTITCRRRLAASYWKGADYSEVS